MIGHRCRYNELHNNSFQSPLRCKERMGTIKGKMRHQDCYYVLWNGNKTTMCLHIKWLHVFPFELQEITTALDEINNFYIHSNPELIQLK